MRMWMIPPEKMCRKHLLGEHVELHMLAGHLFRKRNVGGFVKNNLIQVKDISARHDEIAKEMIARGYQHSSPLMQPNVSFLSEEERCYEVDKKASNDDLIKRCSECRKKQAVI